jgi:hypothetical protein
MPTLQTGAILALVLAAIAGIGIWVDGMRVSNFIVFKLLKLMVFTGTILHLLTLIHARACS